VGESIATIQRCVNDIERLDSRKVTVAASLDMSSFWLKPAILAFPEQHPEIDIGVLACTCDLQRDPVDFAIQYGDGHWPGITAIEILEEVLFPVCSPQYLQQRGISRVEDITQETLIDYDKSNSRCTTTAPTKAPEQPSNGQIYKSCRPRNETWLSFLCAN
jgi:DNA-binding transcriptional LysR family regulator